LALVALAALVAAHLFDLASFLVMTARHGLAAEANPIVVALAEAHGVAGLTVVKLASVTFVASTFVVIAPRRRRLAMTIVIIGIAAGLVGGLTNVATI
jgi:hypothetical protein